MNRIRSYQRIESDLYSSRQLEGLESGRFCNVYAPKRLQKGNGVTHGLLDTAAPRGQRGVHLVLVVVGSSGTFISSLLADCPE